MLLLPFALLAGVWITLPDVLQERQEVAVAAADGKVFLMGGLAGTTSLTSVEEFDPNTNRWRNVAPLPEPLHHAAAATLGRSIYVIGGYRGELFSGSNPSDSVYRYDLDTDRWSSVARLPAARAALAAATIGDRIFAVGGVPGNGRALTVYDAANDRWTTLPSMPTGREHLGAAAVGGRLYVASGRLNGNTDAFEVFDPVTNGWASLPPIPTARSGIAVAAVGTRIYVFGGELNPLSPTGVFGENESFDVVTGRWERDASMPVPRHGIGAAVIGKTIFIPAGAEVDGLGTSPVFDAFVTEIPGRRRAVRK